MAEHKVGKTYVEIDLDWEPYSRAQKRLKKDATDVTSSIEKSYRNLGITSAKEFDYMRAKIVNSYNMIANSAQATASDILRAEKAKNEQLKALDTKQFRERNSLLQTFKNNWLAVTAAITAAYFAVKRAWGVINEAVQAASNLEEVSSKFNVVFKGLEADAGKWSKVLVESFAMSTRESKQYLAAIQDLLKPMGIAADKAGELSFEVVKLSADLGSFNNMPTAKVMADIQSALVGNYETMKKYGVIIKDSIVQEKALAMGLAETKKELTTADKAMAAYTLIVEGSKDAIGDMARTSDSYANQQKKLTAQIEDFKATLGTELLPVLTDTIEEFNKWFDANGKLLAQDVGGWLTDIATAVGKIYDAYKELGDFLDKHPLLKTISSIGSLGAAIYAGKYWWEKAFGPEAQAAVYDYKAALEGMGQELDNVEEKVNDVVDSHEEAAEDVKATVIDMSQHWKEYYGGALEALAHGPGTMSIEEFEKTNKESAEKIEKTTKNLTSAMKDTFIHDFFDRVIGQGEDLIDWWKNMAERIKGYFLAAVADMVAGWIFGVNTMSGIAPTMSMAGGGGGLLGSVMNFGGGDGGGGFSLGGITSFLNPASLIPDFSTTPVWALPSMGALSQIPGIGSTLASGLGYIAPVLPLLGVLGLIGSLTGLFGKDHQYRRDRRGQFYISEMGEMYNAAVNQQDWGSMIDVATSYPIYFGGRGAEWGPWPTSQLTPFTPLNQPGSMYPGWESGLKIQDAGWKYTDLKDAMPQEDYWKTIAYWDDITISALNSLDAQQNATVLTAKALGGYRDEIELTKELMGGWGEEAQETAAAMIEMYDSMVMMTVEDLWDKFEKGHLSFKRFQNALDDMEIDYFDQQVIFATNSLNSLLNEVDIGSDKFFEMYDIMKESTVALADMAVAAENMAIVESLLTTNFDLTEQELIVLVTYYRQLKLALEGDADALIWLTENSQAAIDIIKEQTNAVKLLTDAYRDSAWQATYAAQTIGSAFKQAFSPSAMATYATSWDTFYDYIRLELYNTIVDTIITALLESEMYKAAMQPLFDALATGLDEAWTDGSFDAQKFFNIVDPALLITIGNIEGMGEAFGVVWNVVDQILKSLGLTTQEINNIIGIGNNAINPPMSGAEYASGITIGSTLDTAFGKMWWTGAGWTEYPYPALPEVTKTAPTPAGFQYFWGGGWHDAPPKRVWEDEAWKIIPSFQHGGLIPHDMLAYLHAGETVIPTNETWNLASQLGISDWEGGNAIDTIARIQEMQIDDKEFTINVKLHLDGFGPVAGLTDLADIVIAEIMQRSGAGERIIFQSGIAA